MMIVPRNTDPYYYDPSKPGFVRMNEWEGTNEDLFERLLEPFETKFFGLPVASFFDTPKNKFNKTVKKNDMDIERLKTYTAQLKELEAKLADLEPKVEEKKVDIEELLQKVKGGFIHDGVKRSMDYNIKMNQLFYDNDADIPGKKEAIEAMSMSYLLSEKFNEWEKVAIPYNKCKNQLKYLKRKYADIKDTLVQALQCLEENLPEEKN